MFVVYNFLGVKRVESYFCLGENNFILVKSDFVLVW